VFEELINTVNIEKKEIYGSRSGSASPSGNGNGDKVGESLQSVFELSLQSQGPDAQRNCSKSWRINCARCRVHRRD